MKTALIGSVFAVSTALAQETPVNLSFGIEQISAASSLGFWMLIIAILIVLAVFGYLLFRMFSNNAKLKIKSSPSLGRTFNARSISVSKEIAEKEEQKERTRVAELPPEVEKYLKEDERIVLRVLQMKGGNAGQGTLRIATNFSKAKLSRVLSELEERGVIHKDKEGKRNTVSLRF